MPSDLRLKTSFARFGLAVAELLCNAANKTRELFVLIARQNANQNRLEKILQSNDVCTILFSFSGDLMYTALFEKKICSVKCSFKI